MIDLAENAYEAPTTACASTTTHRQRRSCFAKLPIVWLCKGWPPLHMCGGVHSGWGLICISSYIAHWSCFLKFKGIMLRDMKVVLPFQQVPGTEHELWKDRKNSQDLFMIQMSSVRNELSLPFPHLYARNC